MRNARRVVRWNLKSHVQNARACTRANAGLALARLPRQSFGTSREINARRCSGGRRRGRAGERFLATIKDEAKIHRNECQFQGFSAALRRSLLSPFLTLRALRVPPLSPRYPSCSSFSSSSSSPFTRRECSPRFYRVPVGSALTALVQRAYVIDVRSV